LNQFSIPKNKSILFYRRLCDASFFYFLKIVGGPKGGQDVSPDIHLPLCEFSQDKTIYRSAIFEPRDWLKTTVFTKWEAIYEYLHNPELRQVIFSENERLGAAMLHWIQRTLLTNKKLRALYPDKLHMINNEWTRRNRWSGSACDLPRQGTYSEPSISILGIGGAAQSGHYDIIRIDDPIGKAAMESPIVMESVFRWFDNIEELLVEPDITRPNPSYVKIRATHWGNGDFGCYVQDKYPEYQWRIVPCLKDDGLLDTENIKWIQNPNVDNDESNWPEYKSTKFYHEMRANPEKKIVFYCQHMNNPQRAEGLNKIDRDWLRFYHFEDRDNGKCVVCDDAKKDEKGVFRIADIPLVGIIDPGGFAETRLIKKGSNNAILIGGQPHDTIKKFVVFTWFGKIKDPEEFQDIVFNAHKEWKPRLWRIETFGAQDYIYRDVLLERKKRGVPLIISPLPKDVSKNVKDADIQSLIPPIANGEIYVHRSMRQLIAEIINYPSGITNDLFDCLAKLFKYHMSRKKREDLQKLNKESDTVTFDGGRSKFTGY